MFMESLYPVHRIIGSPDDFQQRPGKVLAGDLRHGHVGNHQIKLIRFSWNRRSASALLMVAVIE